jgi:predicted RecB family nuclease
MKKLTRDVLESFPACKYKAYLKLIEGHTPKNGNEETSNNDIRNLFGITGGIGSDGRDAGMRHLTPSLLALGQPLLLGTHYETDSLSIDFDGLVRVDGPSAVGDFHYCPLVFHSGQRHDDPKPLLEILGLILNEVQGRMPDKGIVRHIGTRDAVIHLSHGLRMGGRRLRALMEMQRSDLPPTLILNNHCQVCEFRDRCNAQAAEEDNLSLLRGLSEAEIMRLRSKGIFTVTQYSYTFTPRRVKRRAKNPSRPRYFALQARAIREKRIFVHGTPTLNVEGTRVYMDFEGSPYDKSYYLIGLLVVRAGIIDQVSFWADDKRDEVKIFIDLIDYLQSLQTYTVLHFGAYEVRALRRMQRRLPPGYENQIEGVLKKSLNVLSVLGRHVYLPLYSNSLKDVARYLGYCWSAPNASGGQSLLWRREWIENRSDTAKAELLRYNMEDCFALKRVTEFIDLLAKGPTAASSAIEIPCEYTESLADHARRRRMFEPQEFVFPDFAHINERSYFEYQKEKASGRAGRKRKRLSAKRRLPHKTCRNNKIVDITASRCPGCRSKKLRTTRALQRQIIDLKFSGALVKRWIVLCRSHEYHCMKCGSEFIPAGFPNVRTKFGRGLVSWCMYQTLVGGQNLLNVRAGLARLFGINVPNATMYRFKTSVADYYRETLETILSSLINGSKLYIDETAVNLRSETGYVWCITDGVSTYYFYRQSREASFLPDLLQSFRGVLVSDFYTGYDSIQCVQQRCLIHLMRDFNEELLKNPFDENLKALAMNFSSVLRDAVSTIDKHGYKRRFLQKHKEPAKQFCDWASRCQFGSVPVERLRSRIEKYSGKLFTFLDFDDVCWNNTNAEHAIKVFARHRRTADGRFTTRSIQEYLAILSIAETCRGRGEDFLDFLLTSGASHVSFRPRRSPTTNNDINGENPPTAGFVPLSLRSG